jgi:hypothetical protein
VLLDPPTGATIAATFGGVLIVMFCIHLLYFRGHKTNPLRGANSVERSQEEV